MNENNLTSSRLIDSKNLDINDLDSEVLNDNNSKAYENYYIGNEKCALSVIIDSYHRLALINFFDYERKVYYQNDRHSLISSNITYDNNLTSYKDNRLVLTFTTEQGKHHLVGHFKNYLDVDDLAFDLVLSETNDKSLLLKIPSTKEDGFSYYQTINNLHCQGKLTFGERTYDFDDTLGTYHAQKGFTLDKRASSWASLSYFDGTNYLGFHLNDLNTNDSDNKENVLFYNQETYWLDTITFTIRKNRYNKYDYNRLWTISSANKDINLNFRPYILKKKPERVLFNSDITWQAIGYYSGTIKVDGKEFKIDKALGFAQKR